MHTASGWATTVGTTRASRTASAGAHSAIAATAAADIANPGSHASRGSSTATARITPALSAGSAWAGLPHHSAAQITPAMVAARTTDGSGKTTHTSSPIVAPVTIATTRRDLTSSRSAAVTATSTIAKCDPDTAVRWVSPASDICARWSAAIPESSPMTIPRVSGRSRSGSSPVASRSPDLNDATIASRPRAGVAETSRGRHNSAAAPPDAAVSSPLTTTCCPRTICVPVVPAPHHDARPRGLAVNRRDGELHSPQSLGGTGSARRGIRFRGRDQSRRGTNGSADRGCGTRREHARRRTPRRLRASASTSAGRADLRASPSPNASTAPHQRPPTPPQPHVRRREPRGARGRGEPRVVWAHARSDGGDALERRHNRVANSRHSPKVVKVRERAVLVAVRDDACGEHRPHSWQLF